MPVHSDDMPPFAVDVPKFEGVAGIFFNNFVDELEALEVSISRLGGLKGSAQRESYYSQFQLATWIVDIVRDKGTLTSAGLIIPGFNPELMPVLDPLKGGIAGKVLGLCKHASGTRHASCRVRS